MDTDLTDLLRALKTEMLPASPCISRPVNPITKGCVDADSRLARASIDHVAVRWCNGQRPYGGTCQIAVGNTLPVGAAVIRLLDATCARAKIEGHRIAIVARNGNDAPPLTLVLCNAI